MANRCDTPAIKRRRASQPGRKTESREIARETPSFFIRKTKRQKKHINDNSTPSGSESARDRVRREVMEHNRSFLSEQQKDKHTAIAEIASIQRELGMRKIQQQQQQQQQYHRSPNGISQPFSYPSPGYPSESAMDEEDREKEDEITDHHHLGAISAALYSTDTDGSGGEKEEVDDDDDDDDTRIVQKILAHGSGGGEEDEDSSSSMDIDGPESLIASALPLPKDGSNIHQASTNTAAHQDDDILGRRQRKGYKKTSTMAADPTPWLTSFIELDEMRGRIPPRPLEISIMASSSSSSHKRTVKHKGGGIGKGREEKNEDKGGEGGETEEQEPSTEGVICQIQNWVVRLDCVIETLSVQKSIRQATLDMKERHGLRKWARLMYGDHAALAAPATASSSPVRENYSREQYDIWYLQRMAQCNGVRDWRTAMRLASEDDRPYVPVWSRNATHVGDLARRIRDMEGGVHVDPEMVRRPALNLYNLVYNFLPRGGRYDTNNFSALKCPNMSPRATCLIYSSTRAQSGSRASARAVCTGAKTPEEVSWSLHKLMRSMEESGSLPLTVDWRTYKVSNVVASVILLSYTVNLKELDRQCGMQCSYNPSMFPAAILRLRQDLGRVAVLVYSTKLVIAGSKSKKILTRTLRTAIRVTWRARHRNLKSEGARSMLRPHERVFQELLADRHRGMPQDSTAWGIAIQSTRVSTKTSE